VISRALPSSEHGANLKKLIIFLFTAADVVVFGAIYSICVVYSKTIVIHLGVGESGGYLPAITTTIHLNLSLIIVYINTPFFLLKEKNHTIVHCMNSEHKENFHLHFL